MTEHAVEQALRRSHCSHAQREDPQHQCVGSCLITPQGVTLTCKACGDDDRPIAPTEILPETQLVRAVLDALGITYDALAPEYKARAVAATKRWMSDRGRR
ncbi:MAG TPA: hypothetical protein VLE97_07285 [Gaiellaceae bacterium]|nr:hypothetical protein [Gaiellaceae bacterium]